MMLYSECGYFNEERYDEYAPPYGECEECYRYDICRKAKTLEELKSGKMVKLNFSDLSKFISDFPDSINTLMIQKTFDGYCVVVDEVSVCKEKVDRDCSYCKNGTYRKPIHQFDGTLIRRVNFCDECGRDLRGLK